MGHPPGGFADKLGNRYEAWFVVSTALDIVRDQAEWLEWEPLGSLGAGIEYRYKSAEGVVHAVQCKSGEIQSWTVRRLESEGVLHAVQRQLGGGHVDRFDLVLTGRAPLLRDLVERASAAASVDSLRSELQDKLSAAFAQLLAAWNFRREVDDDVEQAIGLLRRVTVLEHRTADHVQRDIEDRAAATFNVPGSAGRSQLRDLLEERFGQRITADTIVAAMRSRGCELRDWSRVADRVAAVHGVKDRFLAQLGRLLVRGQLLHREESDQVLSLLTQPDGPKGVLLHGPAGIGKSGVLYEVALRLHERGTCVLPIRLDNRLPDVSMTLYASQILELPDDPVRCVARLAGSSMGVVIVDQLDAVRWGGLHSDTAWSNTVDLLDAALRTPNVRVVVACRAFDLKDDPRIAAWTRGHVEFGRVQQVEVKPLSDTTVAGVLATLDIDAAALSRQQRTLLTNPLMLALAATLAQRGVSLKGVSSASRLLEAHWQEVKRRVLNRRGIADASAEGFAQTICQWANSRGQLDFPASLVTDRSVIEALASEAFLDQLSPTQFRVSHQRFLDHLIARSVHQTVLGGAGSVGGWVKGIEQSLMRREQLRQVLTLLRDDEPVEYIAALRDLLCGGGVREHMRDLALSCLAEAHPPSADEQRLVLDLLRDPTRVDRVLSRVVRTPPWFEVLDDHGVLQEWLEAMNDKTADRGIWLCKRHGEAHPGRVDRLLGVLSSHGGVIAKRAVFCLPFTSEHDTPSMARCRFAAQRRGELRCEPGEVLHAAKENARSALRFAAHVLRWEVAHRAHPGMMPAPPSKFDRWSSMRGADTSGLRTIAAAEPRSTWETLAPVLLRSLRWGYRRASRAEESERRHVAYSNPLRPYNGLMRSTLTGAAHTLLQVDAQFVWRSLRPFRRLRSRCAARLVLDVVGCLPPSYAVRGIRWLAADVRRCGATGRHGCARFYGARSAVKHLCVADPAFASELVDAIARFHDADEMRFPEFGWDERGTQRRCRVRNLYGLPQYLLLSAVPAGLLSVQQAHRLQQWRSKFGDPGEWQPRRLGGARHVTHSIPDDRIGRVTDRDWLRLMAREWPITKGRGWRDAGRIYVEHSHETFSRAFAVAAKANPERFVRLALRMPLEVSDHYLSEVLGAAEATEPPSDVSASHWRIAAVADIERVLERFGHRDDRRFASELADCLAYRSEEPWSERSIRRVCELAKHHPDPAPGEHGGWGSDASVTAEQLVGFAINCTRGRATQAVKQLLWHQHEHRFLLLDTARSIVEDPHPAVRAVAMGLALPLLNEAADDAIELLHRACEIGDERALASHYLDEVLKYAWWRREPRVDGLLVRMARSPIEKVSTRGAFFVTIVARRQQRMEDVAAELRTGTPAQRLGVAHALARLVESAPTAQQAATDLSALFNDQDDEVAEAAAHVFRQADVLGSPSGPQLAAKFVTSRYFGQDPDDLLFPLADYAGNLLPFQSAIAHSVARAVGDLATENRDMHRSAWGFADRTTEIVLRIYDRAQAPEHRGVRDWCLDQIDALIAQGNHLGYDVLARLDKGD